jgi:glutaredoxin
VRGRVLALLLGGLVLAGCSRGATAVDAGTGLPPPLTLTRDRTDLVFTFMDAEGILRDVDAAEKVPEERRGQVLVRDLSMSPDELQVDRYVFVADLTRDEGGAFPYAVASRYAIDQLLREGDFGPVAAGAEAGSDGVVLYGTAWCGACAQARRWMAERGVAFVEKDIEKDPKAKAELGRKMRRAGMQFGGVPVVEVRGKLMLGFDSGELARMLGGR